MLATQNPIEQEGTYPLPEAQLDRFMLQDRVGYPSVEAELGIVRLLRGEERAQPRPARTSAELLKRAPGDRERVTIAENVERYIVDAVRGDARAQDSWTRELDTVDRAGRLAARLARALIEVSARARVPRGRDYVPPEDVRAWRRRCCATA